MFGTCGQTLTMSPVKVSCPTDRPILQSAMELKEPTEGEEDGDGLFSAIQGAERSDEDESLLRVMISGCGN